MKNTFSPSPLLPNLTFKRNGLAALLLVAGAFLAETAGAAGTLDARKGAGPAPLVTKPLGTSLASGSSLPPGVQELRGTVILEGPAEHAQPVLREKSGRRWSIACVPAQVWNRVVGQEVIVTGPVEIKHSLLRPDPICARKIEVVPATSTPAK